jgi:hypothetical protein
MALPFSWSQHPEPIGSRRATPPLLFQLERDIPEGIIGLDARFEYFRYRPQRRMDHRAIAAERVRRFDADLPADQVFATG